MLITVGEPAHNSKRGTNPWGVPSVQSKSTQYDCNQVSAMFLNEKRGKVVKIQSQSFLCPPQRDYHARIHTWATAILWHHFAHSTFVSIWEDTIFWCKSLSGLKTSCVSFPQTVHSFECLWSLAPSKPFLHPYESDLWDYASH